MKKTLKVIVVVFMSLFLFSCESCDKTTDNDTEAPTVSITYPANNSEFVQGTVITITADADDNKGIKEVKFYIDGNFTSTDDSEPYEYEWDTGTTKDTTHTIYAKAFDTSDNSSTSDVITVTLTEGTGNPPNPPSNPSPSDNATSVSISTDLSWVCTDPDGDPLTYDVYFGTSSNPQLQNSGQSETTYDPGSLIEETIYYWKIVAHDEHSNSTTGAIWEFTTVVNQPPEAPSNPSPANNATSVSLDANLSWSCIDPEGDPLTYDVYFGTTANPPLVNTGQTSNTYDPGTLNYEVTYYWKIVAKDDQSNSTTGEVWQFTTTSGGSGDFEWCDVPAGNYTYGEYDEILTIDYDYQIMKYEVNNTEYVTYLEEALAASDITVTTSTVEGYYSGDLYYPSGNYEFLDLDNSDCRIDWTGSEFTIVPGYEDHPVIEVTWFGSWAFAEHYGFSLPTEQEWEKAARGNTGYDYPWGNSIDGSRANYLDSGDPWDNGTTPVGMYNGQTIQGFSTTDSHSPYGIYDMAGNVLEWTYSWWSTISSARVYRGGSWYNNTNDLRSWYRYCCGAAGSIGNLGFRCVTP